MKEVMVYFKNRPLNGRENATFQLIIKAIWTFSFCWF